MPTYFNKEWLRIKGYKDWLAEIANTKFVKCRVCPPPKKRFALSNMGVRHCLVIRNTFTVYPG